GWAFADGLIDALSAVPGLSIHSRGVTSQARTSRSDARTCGRILGAEVVVHGTLRRSQEGLLAQVQLTTVDDGLRIWRRALACTKGSVEESIDQAAAGICEAMGLSLPRVEKVLRDPEVLDLFLRGRREHFRFTAAGTDRARELLRLASERAP